MLFITFNGTKIGMGCTRSGYESKRAPLLFNGYCYVSFVFNVASVEFISNSYPEREVSHFTLQASPIFGR